MLRIQLYHPRNEFIFKIYFDQILAALVSIRDLFPTPNTHIHTLQRVRELQKLLQIVIMHYKHGCFIDHNLTMLKSLQK